MTNIDQAREFAAKAHATQKRNYTGEPYFNHVEEVAELLKARGFPWYVVAAGYLHDTIEDTPVTYVDIRNHFGENVAELVLMVTDPTIGRPEVRAVRKRMEARYLAGASNYGQSIKLADLISNTKDVVDLAPLSFAKKYIPEKRAVIDVLVNGHYTLYRQAYASLVAAEARLKEKIDAEEASNIQ